VLVSDPESGSDVPVNTITETTEETSGQLIALSEREEPAEQLPLIEGDTAAPLSDENDERLDAAREMVVVPSATEEVGNDG
jgi:hypothetical protein